MKVHGARSIFALAVALSFLFAPALVAAQYYGSNQAVDFIWVKTFGFEKSWLSNPNQLITQAILPTVALYAIFLGLLRTLQIFQGMGSMEHVISIVVCLSAMFTGGIGWISGVMAFLGVWSIAIFILLMIVGGGLYTWGFMRNAKGRFLYNLNHEYKASHKHITQQMQAVEKKQKELQLEMIQKAGNVTEQERISKEIADYTTKRSVLINQIRELNEAFMMVTPIDDVKLSKEKSRAPVQ